MNKLGRKKSSDPIQEALRQEKQDWNEETSELIRNLISLKKGLNGKGDSSEGLPSSSIKEPIPPQIGAYLNEVASSAAKVIEEAKTIINHQDHYSSSRKRRKDSFEYEQEIIKVSELINEASWFGSRFLARNWSLRNLPSDQKALVIDMMYKLLDIKDKLESLEENLIEPKQKGITSSFNESMLILTLYKTAILDKMLQFMGKAKTPHVSADDKAAPAASTAPLAGPALVSLPKGGPPPERESPRRRPEQRDQEEKKIPGEIVKELDSIRKIVALFDSDIINASDYDDYNNFHEKVNLLDKENESIRTKPRDTPVFTILTEINLLKAMHSNLINFFKEKFFLLGAIDRDGSWKFDPDISSGMVTPMNKLPLVENQILNSNSFQDIYLKLPLKEINQYLKKKEEEKKAAAEAAAAARKKQEAQQASETPSPADQEVLAAASSFIEEDLLIKDAGFFRKFIREKILNFNPSAIEIEQRNALYASKEVRKKINQFLDILEDPATTKESMASALDELTSEFKNLFSLMKGIGESYRLMPSEKESIPSRNITYYDRLIKSIPDKINS